MRVRDWLSAFYLVAVAAWVVVLVSDPLPAVSVWTVRDAQESEAWLREAGLRCLMQFAIFFLAGFILPLSIRAMRQRRRVRLGREQLPPVPGSARNRPRELHSHDSPRRIGVFRRGLRAIGSLLVALAVLVLTPAIVIATGVALTATFVHVGWYSVALDTLVAWMGCCLGWWICWWWSRRWIGRLCLVLQIVALVVLGNLSVRWLAPRVLELRPGVLEPVAIRSEDKRALVESIQEQSVAQGASRVYRMSALELNQLLSWWLAVTPWDVWASTLLADDGSTLHVTGHLAIPRLGHRFVNVVAWGECSVLNEHLELRLDGVRVGELILPRRASRWLGERLANWVRDEPRNAELLTGIEYANVDKTGAEVSIAGERANRMQLADLLRKFSGHPDVTQEVRAQVRRLVTLADQTPVGEPRFNALVQAAFEHARTSSQSGDAAVANRVAILALGIVLGHVRMETLVGDVCDEPLRELVGRVTGTAELHQRADWVRHFALSAAISLVANGRVSDQLGLLKEEVDAGPGGSGFSFADLLADRAGTEFAKLATDSESSARLLQQRICTSEPVALQKLLPVADGLPEGLDDAAMQEQFDGVGGARYLRAIDDIERRVRETIAKWSGE